MSGPARKHADDNEDSAQLLSEALRFVGHQVHTAFDGQGALQMFESIQPQIALLDIGMPRVNGYAVARQIRQRFGHGSVLIALTGWGQDEDRRRAEEAGFNFHLTKPIDLDALEQLIIACRSTPASVPQSKDAAPVT